MGSSSSKKKNNEHGNTWAKTVSFHVQISRARPYLCVLRSEVQTGAWGNLVGICKSGDFEY